MMPALGFANTAPEELGIDHQADVDPLTGGNHSRAAQAQSRPRETMRPKLQGATSGGKIQTSARSLDRRRDETGARGYQSMKRARRMIRFSPQKQWRNR
jgi:hypothetical protein